MVDRQFMHFLTGEFTRIYQAEQAINFLQGEAKTPTLMDEI